MPYNPSSKEKPLHPLTEKEHRLLKAHLASLEKCVTTIEPGWERDSLRTAWYCLDAISRHDQPGLYHAMIALNQAMGEAPKFRFTIEDAARIAYGCVPGKE